MKYPSIDDDDFYKKINNIYKKFTIPKKKKSFDEICIPKKYKLQLPQIFLSEFINPKTQYKGVLVYHRIGAGKTCSAVRIAEKWKKIKRIVVVLPASLKSNFRTELRSLCADNNYLKQNEREELKDLHPRDERYKEIIKISDDRIDKYYEIYSYNKFIDYIKEKSINLKNTVLIIDEIQNMVSEEGTYYEMLYNLIHKTGSDLRVILLSATPMFDKPHEIGLTMNLLRVNNELPTGKDFEKKYINTIKHKNGAYTLETKNLDDFKNRIKGYISYFRGAPPYVFPEMTVKYVKCQMSDFQYSAYRSILKNEAKKEHKDLSKVKKKISKDVNMMSDLPNNFFIGSRFASNIVFPNKMSGDDGFESMTNRNIQRGIHKYSAKFNKMITKINNAKGKVFVYSSFKEYAGLRSFVRVLKAFGYKDYAEYGMGKKRFAVWSSDENIAYKDEIKTIFNKSNNINGSKLKIILGSSSIKEGVSFTAVRQVHIIDPYWNWPRLSQVIGRASRFCSHKELPEEERNVKVYIYIATHENERETIDQYIHSLSVNKNKLVQEFERAIKEAAIDCKLNKYANISDDENDFVCDK
jgi:hypothetical protein